MRRMGAIREDELVGEKRNSQENCQKGQSERRENRAG